MIDNYTRLTEGLKKYKEETGCKGVVLGISGGKDSTVVAMLLKKVWGDKVVGVIMPNGDQKDLTDCLEIVKTLKIKNYVVFLAVGVFLRDYKMVDSQQSPKKS